MSLLEESNLVNTDPKAGDLQGVSPNICSKENCKQIRNMWLRPAAHRPKLNRTDMQPLMPGREVEWQPLVWGVTQGQPGPGHYRPLSMEDLSELGFRILGLTQMTPFETTSIPIPEAAFSKTQLWKMILRAPTLLRN